MSAVIELARQGKPYQYNAGPGDRIRCVEDLDGQYVEQDLTVLDVKEHGYFIFLDCEKEDGHVHQVQVFRDGRPSHGTVISLQILQRISRPDWQPPQPHKDPVVPG